MKVSLISFIHKRPLFHQNTSASVSESCGRVERLLHGSGANAMKRPSGRSGLK
ncbi:MAG: hypothetical protein GDA51_07130 [Ekhidna sp.]|nr:hypothetical protein [Ekhidna sp.]